MPKVTLQTGTTFSLAVGKKIYSFTQGISQKVSVGVAIVAKKRKNQNGQSLFSVAHLSETPAPKKALSAYQLELPL